MSSIPGYRLEDFVMWLHKIKVEQEPDANPSLQIAEALGQNPNPRPVISKQTFQKAIEIYEPYREDVEYKLECFEEHSMSWRDYSGFGTFDFLPDKVKKEAGEILGKPSYYL